MNLEQQALLEAMTGAVGEVAGAVRELREDLTSPTKDGEGAINELARAIRYAADTISEAILTDKGGA